MKVAALLGPSVKTAAIRRFQIHPDIQITPVEQLTADWDAALIFGGDGTVHRYLPQLHAFKIPVLVVPSGSGNDFAHTLGIHNSSIALQVWKGFCAGQTNVRKIDLGLIRKDKEETLFCCVAGAGLDAQANARANRMPTWLRGAGGYLVAALQTLIKLEPLEIHLNCECGCEKCPGLFVAIGNASRYGHGFKVAPKAALDDGKLDICLVRRMNKMKVLCCLPTIYFGAHLRLREVSYFQAPSARLDTRPRLELYADGEYICDTPVEISVAPGALKVISPKYL
ncbi:MAG: hypothetical protein DMG65_10590 [Candidatus Angelobacter sp. Gp1-AA117]|nr:MAG: hypothetical protein DMG65_10590 [Candidatus Angelobacter sp. Gp1-AA117]